MIAETLLTLVVSILSVDQGVATVDRGRLAGLRPGDGGRIYYQLTVGAGTKRIDVGEGTLIEVDDSRSRLRIDGEATVRPGYLVEFEIPLTSTGSGSSPETAGVDPALGAWIERLLPGNREVQAEVVRLIRTRRTGRGPAAGSDPNREAELPRARVEELEASRDTRADDADLRTRLGQEETRRRALEADVARARAEVTGLSLQLEQARGAQSRLEAELTAARSDARRLRTPEQPPEAITPDPSREAEVVAEVRSWARAWSEQRVDDYLSFYGLDFQPPEGMSRSEWEARRRPRVLGPSFIEVRLEDLEILSMGAGRAAVQFRQRYRSDTFSVAATKVLELAKEEGEWKIVAETIE